MKPSPFSTQSETNEQVRKYESRDCLWIWEGAIAIQGITLLSAPEKTGKTTLLSLLLDRRREGGELLGRRVSPGRSIVCSEEISALWSMRQPPLDFGSQLEFHRPPRRRLSDWIQFIDHLLELGDKMDCFDLLIIDTAMAFLPALENTPRRMRRALDELRLVPRNSPAGILLLHQAAPPRDRTRPRGILAAFADILIDMRVPVGQPHTRRRDFDGVGRFPGVFTHIAAELNAEGTDYHLLPDNLGASSNRTLEIVRQILAESAEPLTRQEILDRWPSMEAPAANTLWRALTGGCEQGIFIRTGAGSKAEAFRYGVGGR